jgi:hypothetical protein
MKKLLIMMLCAALSLSLVTIPVSAASSSSVDRMITSAAALTMMGALQGDGSGSLDLGGTLTRAQFCKLAVVVMGLSKSVGQYSSYTIFPDVPSSGWASGYVNLAVRSAGIMTGYSNGKFGPDDIITYGQAVTVLMKMLGYKASDVGAKWPDGFIAKADELGLTDGVSLNSGDAISRGSASILFVNMLNTEMNGSAKKFMTSISGATVISSVFLVSNNATADDGTTGAVRIAGASTCTYLPAYGVPDALQGMFGTLVLNAAGRALILVPETSGRTVVSTVSGASAGAITCADGTKITMNSTASFYVNGSSAAYTDSWVDIEGGMLVSAYYSDGGAVRCVLVANAESVAGSVSVVTSGSYALPSSASVYINGCKATAADIEKYDVVSDNGSGLYNVSRNALTGLYQNASPNTDAPDTVTVLGTEFTVLDSAVSSLSGFKIGDSVTLLLTSDGRVAGAVAGAVLACTNYGVVTSLTSTSATVQLMSGVTVSDSVMNITSDIAKGSLVRVSNYDADDFQLTAMTGTSSAWELNISTGTLGSFSLSAAATVYECVGNSAVSRIKLSDIRTATVEASKVRFYALDPAGKVSLLLLSDATGDLYTYGFIKNGSVTQTSGSLSATNPTTSVTNGDGTSVAVIGNTGLSADTPAGIASTADGVLAGYATLASITGVSRSSFREDTDGTLYVSTAVGLIEVSGSVQAFVRSTSSWTTLSKARSFSDSLTVYYDKTPTSGGKIRIVVAE